MILFVIVFIWKDQKKEFAIIIVYVDNINIIGTPNELTKAIDCLKKEFEMKDLEKAKILFEITNWVFKQRCFLYIKRLI